MTSIATTKLFYPLDGAELKKIILDDFKAQLDNNQLLQAHLTFPTASFDLELTISSYPMDNEAKIKLERLLGDDPDPKTTPVKQSIRVSRKLGETQATAPDAMRIEHELPVLETQRSDSGQLVDGERKRGPVARITVGKGARARGIEPAAALEPTLGDDGEPVKANKFES